MDVAGAHQCSLGGSLGKVPNDVCLRGSGVLGHRECLGLGEQSNGPLKGDRVEITKDRILTNQSGPRGLRAQDLESHGPQFASMLSHFPCDLGDKPLAFQNLNFRFCEIRMPTSEGCNEYIFKFWEAPLRMSDT